MNPAFMLPIFLLYILSAACTKTETAAPPADEYKLVWEDNFEGSNPDLNKWFHRQPGVRHDGFNDESAVYLDGAGNAVIRVYSDTLGGVPKHHTGMIATKREFLYGRIECRVAFSNQPGSWSAFWLQSSTMGNPVGNPRLAGMEIDVVESLPADGRVHINLHWDGYGASHKSAGHKTGDLGCNDGQFHTYVLEWTPDHYKFFVDGKLQWQYSTHVSQRSEFIILSSEVRNGTPGQWAGAMAPGGYGTKSSSNTIMKVDYVKVYQKM
jgi:beta-glucanase (GH16 family)